MKCQLRYNNRMAQRQCRSANLNTRRITEMKKIVTMLLVVVMVLGLAACGSKTTTETKAPTEADVSVTEKATETEAARPHFDKLTLEFVPSKDADVIIAGTENLPELVKAEMAKLGYDIDEVDITVGTS